MMQAPTVEKKPKIAIIDDDPDFCGIFSAIANHEGIDHETFSSLDEMGNFTNLKNYDLVVVDYTLPNMTGVEIAEYIDIFFGDIPVILISASDSVKYSKNEWPGCIRQFKQKKYGVAPIIQSTLQLLHAES